MNKRKGFNRQADIPTGLLQQLNAGAVETATLAEILAIDCMALMRCTIPEIGTQALRLGTVNSITQRMALAGEILFEHFGADGLHHFRDHPADTVRGWAAYLISRIPGLDLSERLRLVRPLAEDSHFGVREWAWLALRPHVAENIQEGVALLQPWTAEPSANLRRFAIEITRPRGVWCSHIKVLKEHPDLGLPLLEGVRSDAARYVQNSVANWLNDASKSRPDWVQETCARWQRQSSAPETAQICRRALRSLMR